jgi:hypothetical protein
MRPSPIESHARFGRERKNALKVENGGAGARDQKLRRQATTLPRTSCDASADSGTGNTTLMAMNSRN